MRDTKTRFKNPARRTDIGRGPFDDFLSFGLAELRALASQVAVESPIRLSIRAPKGGRSLLDLHTTTTARRHSSVKICNKERTRQQC